ALAITSHMGKIKTIRGQRNKRHPLGFTCSSLFKTTKLPEANLPKAHPNTRIPVIWPRGAINTPSNCEAAKIANMDANKEYPKTSFPPFNLRAIATSAAPTNTTTSKVNRPPHSLNNSNNRLCGFAATSEVKQANEPGPTPNHGCCRKCS